MRIRGTFESKDESGRLPPGSPASRTLLTQNRQERINYLLGSTAHSLAPKPLDPAHAVRSRNLPLITAYRQPQMNVNEYNERIRLADADADAEN